MTRAPQIFVGLAAGLSLLTACLAFPDSLATSVAFSFAFVAVLGSVVGALVCHGRRAAFWQGFAMIAAAYLAFALSSEILSGTHRGISQVVEDSPPQRWLPTSLLLATMYDALGGEEMWTYGGSRVPAATLLRSSPGNIPIYLDMSSLQKFLSTGHCVFAVVLGLAGGWLGEWAYRRAATVA